MRVRLLYRHWYYVQEFYQAPHLALHIPICGVVCGLCPSHQDQRTRRTVDNALATVRFINQPDQVLSKEFDLK